MKRKVCLVLDNIRSVHNVGSIFRTADTAGITKIFLIGTTPKPIDRFGRYRKDLAKVALGAEKNVFWEYFKDIKECLDVLKEEDFKIVAVEQDKNSIFYKELKLTGKTAFVFGNEVNGVSKEALEVSDNIVEIPMKGKKESLNVSVTVGVILFN